jgi:hypothetical protein
VRQAKFVRENAGRAPVTPKPQAGARLEAGVQQFLDQSGVQEGLAGVVDALLAAQPADAAASLAQFLDEKQVRRAREPPRRHWPPV